MRVLATFSSEVEAGFVQSLITEAGIGSELDDAAFDMTRGRSVCLWVADEDMVRAMQIVAAYREEERTKDEHSKVRFPFLAVTIYFAMLWCVVSVCFIVVVLPTPAPTFWEGDWVRSATFFGLLVLVGFLVGCGVALVGLIVSTAWRKLKMGSPR